MEASCKWLLETLQNHDPASLKTIHSRHRAREDEFDLGEVFSFMPSKQHDRLATSLRAALAPSLGKLKKAIASGVTSKGLDEDAVLSEVVAVIRAATEIVWLFVHERKEPPLPSLRDVIIDLHGVLLALPPGQAQNQVAKICEWLWKVRDEQRNYIIPQTMLFLLLRSFGGESEQVAEDGKRVRSGGSTTDVNRVYAMRQAFDSLELSEAVPDSETIRNLLLRCATSALYLRVDNGRKFLAYLLTVEDVRTAFLAALLNQVGHVRKTRAPLYGTVFLLAWKIERSPWLGQTLMTIAEKAIYAGTEPFAANLRSILSTFHANKRIPGVDSLLNRTYGPVLYRNLMVANPKVRKNAVMILADAFPIHDPDAMLQDIEQAIGFQCGKFLHLLEDPSPIVRKAAVEGVSRILGLLWELIPLASAKRMLDLMTSKLAFDMSSAQVRVSVFEGLEFLARNRLAHQLLSVVLPRLGCLIHDNVEKVRLSFLDLLLTVKEKRIRVVRYFDIVCLEDLLLRLPVESAAAATKIMNLVLSSYFPLEKKGKTAEEVASSQVRACLSMLKTNKDAASYFYGNVNLFVPPGPLCEFVMRLSSIALEASSATDEAGLTQNSKSRGAKKGRKGTRKKPRGRLNDENEAPSDNIISNERSPDSLDRKQKESSDPVSLLTVVAEVLASISPSLAKQANSRLRGYVDDIFGGDALTSLLIERGNTVPFRAICWRIGSCISPSKVGPLKVLWRKQLDSVLDWSRGTDLEREKYRALLSALLLCGIRWQMLNPMCAVISGWVDASISGHRTSVLGTKSSKKAGKRPNKSRVRSSVGGSGRAESIYMTRVNALFALRSCAAIIIDDEELKQALFHTLSTLASPTSTGVSGSPTHFIRLIRKGCVGAFDSIVEHWDSGSAPGDEIPQSHVLLDAISNTWKMSLTCVGDARGGITFASEIKEMVHWAAGSELLKSVAEVESAFSLALSCLNLSHVADSAALGYLDVGEMQLLVSMANDLVLYVDMSDSRKLTRPVAELLRISYQLMQHARLDLAFLGDEKHPSYIPVTKASATILATACQALGSCEVQDQITGGSAKLTVLDEFMSDVIASLCGIEDVNVFQDDIGEQLRQSFENADKAEHNLFACIICKVVRSLITSPRPGRNSPALKVYETLLSFMRADGDYPTSRRAAANFICFVINSISAFYDQEEAVPREEARQILAAMEVSFYEQFGLDIEVPNEDEALMDSVCDIQKVLAQLQKLCLPTMDDAPDGAIEKSPRSRAIDPGQDSPGEAVEEPQQTEKMDHGRNPTETENNEVAG